MFRGTAPIFELYELVPGFLFSMLASVIATRLSPNAAAQEHSRR
jgi:hypothetical protein